MIFNEVCDKFTEDARDFLCLYVAFMAKMAQEKKPRNMVEDSDKFYFLYLNLLLKNDIATIMEKENIQREKIDNKRLISVLKVLEKIDIKNTDMAYLDKMFYQYAFSTFLYLRKYWLFLDKEKTCLERLLVDMINEGLFDNTEYKTWFKLEEIKDELDKLACLKEKSIKMKNNGGTARNVIKINEGLRNMPIDLKFGTDLTALDYKEDNILGRQKEFRSMCAYLMDNEKSLIIHGKPGVGKTALVKSLAYHIVQGTAPKRLEDKRIIEISGSELISGCKLMGMLEEKLLKILNYCVESGNIILFIDEIHTLMGLGSNEKDNNDIANILKPYLGDGRVKILGATTTREYNTILADAAFARRFNGLELLEPSEDIVLEILKKTINKYAREKGIRVKYQDETLEGLLKLIIGLSKKKNPNALLQKNLYNPDLALTILRNGYNFAMVDDKEYMDASAIVEGVMGMDYFRDHTKEEFRESALSLTREKTDLKIIK